MAKTVCKFRLSIKVDYVRVTPRFFEVLKECEKLSIDTFGGNSYPTYMGYKVIIDDFDFDDDIQFVFTQSMKSEGVKDDTDSL